MTQKIYPKGTYKTAPIIIITCAVQSSLTIKGCVCLSVCVCVTQFCIARIKHLNDPRQCSGIDINPSSQPCRKFSPSGSRIKSLQPGQ